MFFYQPIILAGEFINHAVVVVIIGLLTVQYSVYRSKAILMLLTIPVLGSLMLLFEFFIGRGDVWPNVFIHVPGISLLLYLAFAFHRTFTSKMDRYFYTYITFTALILSASIFYIFVQHQLVILASTLVQVAAVVSFYFYVIKFCLEFTRPPLEGPNA